MAVVRTSLLPAVMAAGALLLGAAAVVTVRAVLAPASAAPPAVSAGPVSLTVSWRGSDGYEGAAGNRLTVWLSGDGGGEWSSVSAPLPVRSGSLTVDGLNPSTSFLARVSESAPDGELLTESAATATPVAPARPPTVGALTARPGDGRVDVWWVAPAGAGWRYSLWRAPAEDPEAREQVAGAESVLGTKATDLTAVNGRTYRYQVQTVAPVRLPTATTGSGWGATATAHPAALPAAPTGVTAVAGENRVTLRWLPVGAGADGGWPVTGYAVRLGAGPPLPTCRRRVPGPCVEGTPTPTGTVVLRAVTTRPTRYGVSARTQLGWGPAAASAAVQAYTLTPPFRPGMRGPAIRMLQQRLTWAGLTTPLTSVYDKRTTRAVNRLREKVRFDQSGIVTSALWRELRGMTATDGALPKRCRGTMICISKTQMVLRYLVRGKVVTTLDVRFGPESGLSTPEGMFQINWKDRDHISSLYRSPMPFTMNIVGGVAIHYSPFFAADGYAGNSHGCINVRDWDGIEWLYDHADVGTPVLVSW